MRHSSLSHARCWAKISPLAHTRITRAEVHRHCCRCTAPGAGSSCEPRSTSRAARALQEGSRTTATNKKPRHSLEPGVSCEDGLAVTYFRVRNAHYHRRKPVSRFCSGWEDVGPGCCGRQIEEE